MFVQKTHQLVKSHIEHTLKAYFVYPSIVVFVQRVMVCTESYGVYRELWCVQRVMVCTESYGVYRELWFD